VKAHKERAHELELIKQITNTSSNR